MTTTPLRVLAALLLLIAPLALCAPQRADAAARPSAAPSQGQLDAILAPVALYPDVLLTPLLMATTFPDEMSAADQWLEKARNARLKGDALAAALVVEPWNPSVKALVPFPQLLDILASRPVWMHQIGAAFVAEPADVMREIQRLRRAALATGKLKSTKRLVVTERGGAIDVTSADPALVYIPVYNPAVVFGAWAYPTYPPVYIQPPRGFHASGPGMESGIGFSLGLAVVPGLWGWAHPDWGTGAVTIDIAAYNRINRYGVQASTAAWRPAPHSAGSFHPPDGVATVPTGAATKRRTDHAAGKHARHHATGNSHRAAHPPAHGHSSHHRARPPRHR
jgi:hypothetical protein